MHKQISQLGMSSVKRMYSQFQPIEERVRTPLGGFINHSEEPNCYINTDSDENLYSVRPIKSGEELTHIIGLNPMME